MTKTKNNMSSIRESEKALLEQLSSRLGTFKTGVTHNGAGAANISQNPTSTKVNNSKNTTSQLLASKAVANGIAKACLEQNVNVSDENYSHQSIGVIDRLVEEYRQEYSKLSMKMCTDAFLRKKREENDEFNESDNDNDHPIVKEDNVNDDIKFSRCLDIIDEEMDIYNEKVNNLKRRREASAGLVNLSTQPTPKKKRRNLDRPRKGEESNSIDGSSSPKRRGRPKKDTPDMRLVEEITKRYAREREVLDRLPKGAFEKIVEDCKKDMNMEDFNVEMSKIKKRVTWHYMKFPKKTKPTELYTNKNRVIEEVYKRYKRARLANSGQMDADGLETIIGSVKLELGMMTQDLNEKAIMDEVQSMFRKDCGKKKKKTLSEEENKRRQILMNTVTTKYIKMKEEADADGKKSLSKGKIDDIIKESKKELGAGYEEIEVPHETIRGRMYRKNPMVMLVTGALSPDDIDVSLVNNINAILAKGVSVTRVQGLEMAKNLLKGKKLACPETGDDIAMDAKWWRDFIKRNKTKLVYSSG